MRLDTVFRALLVVLVGATSGSAHAAAGRTQGSFDVSADGAATYTIPIAIPPGPRGMQPSLALTYSSLAPNGSMGVGWSLAGLSSIDRCTRAYPIDDTTGPVTLTMSDHYCIGVNRLRLASGTYGAANSTYAKEVDDYSVTTASASLQGYGPQSFTVIAKNGFTYEYGTTANARVSVSANGTVLRWMLNKVIDRDGNSYTIDYAITSGVAEPIKLSWSPASPGGTTYRYDAILSYSDKTQSKDRLVWQVAGNSVISTKRLDSISIQQQGATVRKYTLAYETAAFSKLSRLKSVQECADEAVTDCLPATVMAYQNGQRLLDTSATVNVISGARIVGSADFDGDRKADLVYTNTDGSAWYVLFGLNGGFSSPVPVTGLAGTFGTTVDYDNFLPGDRAAFIANMGGTLYTFSASASRTFPGGVSTGLAFRSGTVPTGVNGSLVWADVEVSTQTDRVYSRANVTPAGSANPVFSASIGAGNSVPRLVTLNGQPFNVRLGSVQIISDRGLEHRDLEGDGFPDYYAALIADYCEPQNSINCPWSEKYVALFRFGGLDIDPPSTWTSYTGSYPVPQNIRFNDDFCSDTVSGSVSASACWGSGSQAVTPPAAGFWMDWDGDGRADLLTNNSSGNIAAFLSTGTAFVASTDTPTIPYATDYRVLDLDGDGLDDLARVDGSTIRYYRHAAGETTFLVQYPDLLSSVTDGNGLVYRADYVSTAHSNYIAGVAGSTSTVRARIVVARATLPDGIGGTYTKHYTYFGAREDKLRGTFLGFEERDVEDSRLTNVVTKNYFRQDFPRTGWMYQTDVLRDASALLSRNITNDDVYQTEATAFRQRYFPYITGSTTETYAAEGSQSLIARQQRVFSGFDFTTGNVGTATTTLSNADNSELWTSTVTTLYEPTTAGCLDLPSVVTVILSRQAPAQAPIVRKVSFTRDGSSCRHKTETVEPDSAKYRVITTYGYDGFGNVNSTSVEALEPSTADPDNVYQSMPTRQSLIYWGNAGLAPETIVNAAGETSSLDYYAASGLLKSFTDPNGQATMFEYDGFGRLTRQTNPDATYTTVQYSDCTGCLQGSQHHMSIAQTDFDTAGGVLGQQYTYLDGFDRPLVTRTLMLNGNYQWSEVQYDNLGHAKRLGVPCLTLSTTMSCVSVWTEFASYDLLGRVKQVIQPGELSALTTNVVYSGLTTTIIDANNRSTSRQVDPNGHLRRSTDANGYYQDFLYDSAGSLIQVTEKPQAGRLPTLFTASYDYGTGAFQKSLTDRALGQRTQSFDGYGQLRYWRDAKNQAFYANYDTVSRLTSRINPDSTQTGFEYGSSVTDHNVGQLRRKYSTTAGQTYSEEFLYDTRARLQQRRIRLPGDSSTYDYDFAYGAANGLLDTLTYPASTSGYRFALKYSFEDSNRGIVTKIADANASSTVFWALTGSMNAFGQITNDQLGGVIDRERLFNESTGSLGRMTAGTSGNPTALQNASIGYDNFGNTSQRQNNLPVSLTENFEYSEPSLDKLDRLTHVDLMAAGGTGASLDIQYDEFGNVQHKTDGFGTDVPVDQSITWTADNYPQSIESASLGESASFAYGPDRSRWKMVYQRGGATETTYYLGLMEKVVTAAGTEYRHYIPGPQEVIGLYSRTSSGVNTQRYFLNDYQGGIDVIVDAAGANPLSRSFTPFGLPRNPTSWSGPPGSTPDDITRQGYTFQTVLGRMGLNHMNGRVQDAITGTFLSPDPFVQDPTNTQSFNRYAYVYNNPMSYTDPSGFDADGFSPWFNPCNFVPCSNPGGFDADGPSPPFNPCDVVSCSNPRTAPGIDSCWKRGGCMVWMWHSFSPTTAPQTAVESIDKKPVASTGGGAQQINTRMDGRPFGACTTYGGCTPASDRPLSGAEWTILGAQIAAPLMLAGGIEALAPAALPTVFAGHGIESAFAGTIVVPEGVALTLPGRAGLVLPDQLGQLIEAGKWMQVLQNARYATLLEGSTTYLPGAAVPNLILAPATDLTVLSTSVTVGEETTLSSLLSTARGLCVWAACRIVPGL